MPNSLKSCDNPPKGVLKCMEDIRRKFFWGETDEEKAIPWDKAIWVQILKSIHGDKCLNIDVSDSGLNSNWRELMKHLKDPDIRQLIKRKCGNGEDTQFWKDRWFGNQLLNERFPRLFNIEEDKNCTVAERIGNRGFNWNWRMDNLRGRLDEQRIQLELEISEARLSTETDRWIITDAPNLEFSVSWFRDTIRSLDPVEYAWPDVWSPWIPKKKIILAWRVIRGRVPAKSTLADMGIDLPDVLCPSCKDQPENNYHLFLKCPLAASMWTRISQWWNMSTPDFNSVKDAFEWTENCNIKETFREVMKVIIIANLNIIWDHRNCIVFDNKEGSTDLAFIRIQEEVTFWLESRSTKIHIDRSNWFKSPFKTISL
ncbi:hypothetical protein LXL04_036799 [Taraxacum kok-saghyz]